MSETNEILKKLVKKSGLSQSQFAYKCDLEPHRINLWINDKHILSYHKLKKICTFLNIKIEIKYEKI